MNSTDVFFDLHQRVIARSLSLSLPPFLHNIFTLVGKGTLKIFILSVNMIILTKHIAVCPIILEIIII